MSLTMNAFLKAGTAMSNYTSVLILLLVSQFALNLGVSSCPQLRGSTAYASSLLSPFSHHGINHPFRSRSSRRSRPRRSYCRHARGGRPVLPSHRSRWSLGQGRSSVRPLRQGFTRTRGGVLPRVLQGARQLWQSLDEHKNQEDAARFGGDQEGGQGKKDYRFLPGES